MNDNRQWMPGEIIVYRGVSKKKIWYALPTFLVQDTPGLVALYWPSGTRGKWRMLPSGGKVTPQEALSTPMEIIDRTWDRTDVLMLIKPEVAHAVYLMWSEGMHNLLCWYINLQDPIRRTPIGFDTKDHFLDVVVSPDQSNWYWKDEDQLRNAISLGIFSELEGKEIRAEGERAIQSMFENRAPFCDGWEKWRPPSHWTIPILPVNWAHGCLQIDALQGN